MRPNTYPAWATNEEQDPITGANNKVAPSEEFQLVGLKRGLPLPRAFVNYQFDLINDWIEYFDIQNSEATAANGDTSPDVEGVGVLFLQNTAATTITNFDTTDTRHTLEVIALNGNTTIQNNVNILLDGGVDFVMAENDVLHLRKHPSLSYTWIETSRSVK